MSQTHTVNILDPNCPSRRTLALLADKWVLLILVLLSRKGTLRNGQLKQQLGDISQKMLSQTLRRLEHNGLVERKAYDEIPPRVEYSLTPLGDSLMEPIGALCDWSETHYGEIDAAQARSKIG